MGRPAHGRFGDRTETTRGEYWTSRDRDWLLAGLGGIATIGCVGALALARGQRRLPPRR